MFYFLFNQKIQEKLEAMEIRTLEKNCLAIDGLQVKAIWNPPNIFGEKRMLLSVIRSRTKKCMGHLMLLFHNQQNGKKNKWTQRKKKTEEYIHRRDYWNG